MRILLSLLVLFSFASADLKNVWVTQDFLKKDIKIIDIRTPGEWKQTGIVEGSYPIMFYNEQGGFNIREFLDKLNKVVKKDEQFALICRTGSRTALLSRFLAKEFNYNVINLAGGIEKLMQEGYTPPVYVPQER